MVVTAKSWAERSVSTDAAHTTSSVPKGTMVRPLTIQFLHKLQEHDMWKIKGINHISFAVNDLDEAIENAVKNMGGELMMKFESVTD